MTVADECSRCGSASCEPGETVCTRCEQDRDEARMEAALMAAEMRAEGRIDE